MWPTTSGVGWDFIKDLQKRALQRRYRKPRLGKLKQIVIGFRDQEFFKLKILALHEAKYSLVG